MKNTDTPTPLAGSGLPAALCSPVAKRVREEIWSQFCDWWTGREHAKEVKDFAFTLFNIGYEAGEMANAPLKIMRERLLNWWRCDGGMDTLGQIMDDLESSTTDIEKR